MCITRFALALLFSFGILHLQFGKEADPRTSGQPESQVALNQLELPTPTGPLAIATKIYVWTDRSRNEKASNNPQDFRQLVVQVWYPTEDVSGPTTPYVPMLSAYRKVWDDADVKAAERVVTHSRLDKKPRTGMNFPIVIFSHGWQGTRSEYTSIAEDLASHGYAVFGIDHPYMGRVAYLDGHVTESTEDQFQSRAEIMNYYAQDIRFAIDEISKLAAADPDGTFTGILKLSRIATIGHSSGFVAAGTACRFDRRISACVNLDAPGFSAADLDGLTQPLLWVRLERAGPVPPDFLKSAPSPVYELRTVGTKHGSVEDWDYLEAKTPVLRDKAAGSLQLIRKYLIVFLDAYLKDQNSELLKQDSGNSESALIVHRKLTQ
jgi:pimeloyl-ACP methyl ester carboxylesterase